MDSFYDDVSKVSPIENSNFIVYKKKWCMVRKLNNDSNILKQNPELPYLIRYIPGDKFKNIYFIPISKDEYIKGKMAYEKDKMNFKQTGKGLLNKKSKSIRSKKLNHSKKTKNNYSKGQYLNYNI